MRTRLMVFAGLALTAVVITGCGGTASSSDVAVAPEVAAEAAPNDAGGMAVEGAPAPDAMSMEGKAVGGDVGGAVIPPTDRQIVRTGSMSMTADDVTKTAFAIHALVNRYQGLISGEDTSNTGEMTYSNITAQIPADNLDAFVAEVSKLGHVESVNVAASDVTSQVVDLDARIKAAQTSVDRMTQLMSQAQRIEDLLAIEGQLSARQAELDSLTAQRKYLGDQVALSTISISVAPTPSTTPPTVDAPGFWTGLQNGWAAFVSAVVVAMTAVGFFLPFLIVIALIVVPLVTWAVRQSRRSRRMPPPAAPEHDQQPRDLTPVG